MGSFTTANQNSKIYYKGLVKYLRLHWWHDTDHREDPTYSISSDLSNETTPISIHPQEHSTLMRFRIFGMFHHCLRLELHYYLQEEVQTKNDVKC